MPTQIIAWMQAVQGLILISPDVILFSAKVKGWIKDMFDQGLMPAETQNALNQRVNDICAKALSGDEPDHWLVEKDPT